MSHTLRPVEICVIDTRWIINRREVGMEMFVLLVLSGVA
jgi:hypothetical protein